MRYWLALLMALTLVGCPAGEKLASQERARVKARYGVVEITTKMSVAESAIVRELNAETSPHLRSELLNALAGIESTRQRRCPSCGEERSP